VVVLVIRIGICDDRTEDIANLSEALYNYDPTFQITTFAGGLSLLDEIHDQKALFDIIFLDIFMPGLNGIDIAREIRRRQKDVKIVFISSSDAHYPEAYDVFAFNYILKPLNQDKLNAILEHALMDIRKQRQQQVSFSYKGTTYRIFCKDIMYIESRDKIVLFHMTDKSTLQCYAQLDGIIEKLPEEFFIRCHQSFAVNLLHVTEMADQHFRIDPVVISISKKYREAAKDKYFAYLFAYMT